MQKNSTKFIFITGGVVSSLGKGLAAASLAALLKARGFKVRIRKADPYLNVDPGTMSPIQHGEVFVTEDGAETDLDLGHYERFTGVDASQYDNLTAGKVYSRILTKERRGDYLGGTVQVIPHVTDEIKEFFGGNTGDADFVIIEIGGTVGDIEALPFLEAARQFAYSGHNNAVFVHVTLVPYIAATKELKTKPTQHSVKELRSIGIHPDIILCRAEREIPDSDREKIALFCNVDVDAVISALDVKTIYEAPITYHTEGLDVQVLKAFNISDSKEPNLDIWKEIVTRINNPEMDVDIAIVGKYVKLKDAYKSIIEAFAHAGIALNTRVKIHWINSRNFTKDTISEKLENIHAILVPGGFGSDGIEGKIAAIRYAREHKIPFLGICLGLQLAVIESARDLCGLADASSSEFGQTSNPVIGLMSEWTKGNATEKRSSDDDMGGTMRLGKYPCRLTKGTLAEKAYGVEHISERHRHRYEVNSNYLPQLAQHGIIFSGMSEDGTLPEIMEDTNHPWFVGVQFHPELKSRPFAPHPLFVGLVDAAIKHMKKTTSTNQLESKHLHDAAQN